MKREYALPMAAGLAAGCLIVITICRLIINFCAVGLIIKYHMERNVRGHDV